MRRLLVLAVLIQASCASLKGSYIQDPKLEARKEAAGVTYYLSKPSFEIHRKTLAAGKKAKPVADIVITSEPDYSRRFEVGMKPGWLTSDSFEVSLSKDGTLTSLSGESADVTGKVVSGLVELAAQVAGFSALRKAVDWNPPPDEFSEALGKALVHAEDKKVIASGKADAAKEGVKALTEAGWDVGEAKKKDEAGVTAFEEAATKVVTGLSEESATPKGFSIAERLEVLDDAIADTGKLGALGPSEHKAQGESLKLGMDHLELLESALDRIKAPSSTVVVANTLASLKKGVDERLAAAISDLDSSDKKNKLKEEVKKYKKAVRIILDADVHARRLGKRRELLTEFLTKEFPADLAQQQASAYVQFSKELSEVSSAISALVEPAQPKETELPLATDVTSKVDEGVHVTRFDSPLASADLLARHRAIARARVRFGGCSAAVLVYPTSGGSSDASSKGANKGSTGSGGSGSGDGGDGQ